MTINEPIVDPILIGAPDMQVGGPGVAIDDLEFFDDTYPIPALCTSVLHGFYDITNNACNAPKPTIQYNFDNGPTPDGTNTGTAGNAYNGTLSASISFVPGQFNSGNAAKFRDTTSTIVPAQPTNILGAPMVTTDANPSMTVAYWINWPQLNAGQVFNTSSTTGGGGMSVNVNSPGQALVFGVLSGDPSIVVNPPPTASWHHIIVRYQGQNANQGVLTSIYLDDNLVSSFPTTTWNPFGGNASSLVLGGGATFFLDNFQVFSTAFDQIQQCILVANGQWLYSQARCDYQ
jgi:hypothetical protein